MATTILATCRPCVKCGTQDRNSNGECRECKRVRDAAYRSANASKIAAYQRDYYAKNRESLKTSAALHLEKNRDSINKTERARYSKERHWRAINPERYKAWLAKYLLSTMEKRRIYEHNRRARKHQAGGEISPGLTERLMVLQKGLCPCCRKPLGNDYHMDHIIPLALGGSNGDNNMQLLRSECNLSKSAKDPIDFMQSRGFLL